MCGFSGVLDSKKKLGDIQHVTAMMAEAIQHRGPDGSGSWVNEHNTFSVTHKRLSLLDLSNTGDQPMLSSDGNYVLAFNGEIYNWRDLKEDVSSANPDIIWKSSCDTEVLLEAISLFGVFEALQKCIGMFAIAVYDISERSVTLVRDRLGEKPLYYSLKDNILTFSSEIKSFWHVPNFVPKISKNALAGMIERAYVSPPQTIFCDVKQLPPGHLIKFSTDGHEAAPKCWWSLKELILRNKPVPKLTDDECLSRLDELLNDIISVQLLADVKVGVFMSGGIDSSLVAAIAQANFASSIDTFTASFGEGLYDESERASSIARYIGSNHTEIFVSPNDLLDTVSLLPYIYDEPFGDSSQLPTYLVSKTASNSVKACLTGDGADEVFGGYNRYIWFGSAWKKSRLVPPYLRPHIYRAFKATPAGRINGIVGLVRRLLPNIFLINNVGDKLKKASLALASETKEDFFRKLTSQWTDELPIKNYEPNRICWEDSENKLISKCFVDNMMYWDSTDYLPNDILVKTDRASMINSLELRSPFLDHRLIEFAWSLSEDQKIRSGQGKWALTKLREKYIPNHSNFAPKQGFSVPIDSWLRNELKDWAEDLLSFHSLSCSGLLDANVIRSVWTEHLRGKDYHHALWNVLMFQSWYFRWVGK